MARGAFCNRFYLLSLRPPNFTLHILLSNGYVNCLNALLRKALAHMSITAHLGYILVLFHLDINTQSGILVIFPLEIESQMKQYFRQIALLDDLYLGVIDAISERKPKDLDIKPIDKNLFDRIDQLESLATQYVNDLKNKNGLA